MQKQQQKSHELKIFEINLQVGFKYRKCIRKNLQSIKF